MTDALLLIPPLTQLNTPYPSTAYLTGFLKKQGFVVQQGDLGLDMALDIFNRNGLKNLFDRIESSQPELNHALANLVARRVVYEETIDHVIHFLQGKNYTAAYRIATRNYLPEGPRFAHIKEMTSFFGNIGVQDKSRYLCSLYLEDISDLIQATVGPHFGFSKYAERISRTATSFDPIALELEKENSYTDDVLVKVASKYFEKDVPLLVGLTVPFPGNLYGALKVAQCIKTQYPTVKIALGGGYVNTELRELSDKRIFDYVDFITFDDGEAPLVTLLNTVKKETPASQFKRTMVLVNDEVSYQNNSVVAEFGHHQKPAPDYDGLRLGEYLSMFDVPNPMHRLWNDGHWNKLTVAHGCYWKKCSFCDISLDYIARYEPTSAEHLVNQIEELIAQTGETGFHFVDEAAPPMALRDLALEIIRRELQITWWTNIRFEKTFTPDLCKLLADSGCIAVTGGLEVASDRLLAMMEKGITIEQVSRVCRGFRDAGIMVHAYLMYGFPTQTAQETIDSLEVVRQLFEHNLIQSGFWHRFAMTVHSPVGIDPAKYKVVRTGPEFQGFANNDLFHDDPTGADHDKFSDGLVKALYNYMHGKSVALPLNQYFNFPVPNTTVQNNLISKFIKQYTDDSVSMPNHRLMWNHVKVTMLKQDENGCEVLFIGRKNPVRIKMPLLMAEILHREQESFEFSRTGGIAYDEFLGRVSESMKISPGNIINEPWWKKWRREVVWLVRI